MLIKRIVKRDGTVVDYNRDRIGDAILKATVATGKPATKLSSALAKKVEQALCDTYNERTIPSVEDIQDIVESVMMSNGRTDLARGYIIYRHQRAMQRATRASAFQVSDNIPYKKIYEVLRWNIDHQCESIPSLNKIITDGKYTDLVMASERRYSDEAAFAGSLILERINDVRIVIVAGPSSSGKTTTMMKVSQILKKAGVRLKAINIDNYFFDLDKHPVDEFGDHDYETPEALDLKLINQHLEQLLAGKTIRTPHYNFKTGLSTPDMHPMKLEGDEILLIDSLHGLYSRMTDNVPCQNKFKLYIETLGQFQNAEGTFMRWADNRLLRRMIRDKTHRSLKPIQTLTHWHYVRRSELTNIIPFMSEVDFVVNSAMPYELPLLKHRLFRYISASRNRFMDDPKRLDAHIRANRVYDFLKPLKPMKDDSCVPADSLIREFIGGSELKY